MIARPAPDLVRTEGIDEAPSDWVDRVSQDFRDSAAMDVNSNEIAMERPGG
jgi:hypothetical protein